MSRSITQSHTHTTITVPAINPDPSIPSIRSIILTGLFRGTDRKIITQQVQSLYPSSAAAMKSVKHIAWYSSRVRKIGTPEHKQFLKMYEESLSAPQQGCAVALLKA